MQTMMSGIWARISLRLEALEMRSVNFVIRLSQPRKKKQEFTVRKSDVISLLVDAAHC